MMNKTSKMLYLFLCVFLFACAPTQQIPIEINNTAMAIVQTSIVQTQTAQPTLTLTPTVTATVVIPTPSPLPTQPSIFFMVTPNALQIERWREYEIALAQSLLPNFPTSLILCEWIILGQSDLKQEIYMLAVCGMDGASSFLPAVIYLNSDDSIKKVQKIDYGSTFEENLQLLFPSEVQNIVYSDLTDSSYERLKEHLDFRLANTGYPPLIVTSITSTP